MRCSACGFENIEPSERCSQCDAELKKSVYVASISAGLKRLEKEKLAFLGEDSVPLVSKFSDEDVARFAMLAPMDAQDIDRMASCDETMELKEIAAISDLEETLVLDPEGTDILTPGGGIRSLHKDNVTHALPDSHVYRIDEAEARSEPSVRVSDEVQEVGDGEVLDDLEEGGDAPKRVQDAEMHALPLDSPSDMKQTMFDPIQDLDLEVVEADSADVAAVPRTAEDAGSAVGSALASETLYEEVQQVDALLVPVPESEVMDVLPDAQEDTGLIQDVGAYAVQTGERSVSQDVMAFRTVYDEIQLVDAVDVREEGDAEAVSAGDDNDIFKKIRHLDKALEPMENKALPQESVYGVLSLESVGVSSASEVLELKGMDQIPQASVDTVIPKNARILRHDFRIAPRSKIHPDASAMEQLKADGVFDTSRSHAEVKRTIDSLILDDFIPRSQFSTWHGDVSIDDMRIDDRLDGESAHGMHAVSGVDPLAMLASETAEQKEQTVYVAENKNVEHEKRLAGRSTAAVRKDVHGESTTKRSLLGVSGERLAVGGKDTEDVAALAPVDLSEESIVGAVSDVAPDNETLASIAEKISPKTSGTSHAAVARQSKEIPCPYDATEEARHDEKLLSLLDDDQDAGEPEEDKTELAVRRDDLNAPVMAPMPKHSRPSLAVNRCDAEGVSDGPSKASKEGARSPKTAADGGEGTSLPSQTAPGMREAVHDPVDSSSGVWGGILWGSVFVLLCLGCLYLLYIMGVFAGIDPRLDPHVKQDKPVIVSAPAYETSKAAIRRAVAEAQSQVKHAMDFESYVAQQIERELVRTETKREEEIAQNIELYALGVWLYPDRFDYVLGLADAYLEARQYAKVHDLVQNLDDAEIANPEIFDKDHRAYLEDKHFIAPVETIVAADYDDLSPLGGGSTLTFKLLRDKVPVAAVKPLQTRLQSNYRAEVAAWRLCELLRCDFRIPYNKEIRFEYGTFNLMYSRSRSRKAEVYQQEFTDLRWKKDEQDGKTYLYAAYKDWVPDFTRFPIELKALWKPWLSASEPMTKYPDLKEALKPIYRYAPTSDLYDDIMRQSAGMTTKQLASQISQVLTFDFLIGNFDRFSGVPQWFGVNCQFKDGHIVSIDNGAGFQWGGNTQTTDRFMLVERFSRHFIRSLRRLDKTRTCDLLFPDSDSKDQASCDQFWKRHFDVLERVDALIKQYGEAAVLAFP